MLVYARIPVSSRSATDCFWRGGGWQWGPGRGELGSPGQMAMGKEQLHSWAAFFQGGPHRWCRLRRGHPLLAGAAPLRCCCSSSDGVETALEAAERTGRGPPHQNLQCHQRKALTLSFQAQETRRARSKPRFSPTDTQAGSKEKQAAMLRLA